MKSDAIKKGKPARQPRARRARSPKVTKSTNTHHSSISSTGSSSIQPENVSLTRTLETLKPHDHLCLIYESQEEWRAAAVPFISIGLKRGEKCIYVVDTSPADEIRKYLGEEGVNVAAAEKSGQLSILHETEAYTREGSFDPDRMIALLISETEKAIVDGYPTLRATGEMTWMLRGHPGSERLLEYEAKLNWDFFPKYPCLTICQYDRWKFEPDVIKGVIMTHPLLVRGNNIYHNFYYIPPEEYLNQKRAEMEVQYCLNNLERERQIQETLRQSEEMYRTLTEQSLQGIAVMQDFRIVFSNTAFAEISGYSVEELLSMPPAKVQAMIHPEDQALVWGRFKDRLAGKTVPHRYEYRGIRKDQTVRWLEMHSSPIRYGGKPAILGAIIDITEHKQAGDALRESEEKYHQLFELSSDALFLIEVETGKILDLNNAAVEMYGYSRGEALQMKNTDFSAEPDKTREATKASEEYIPVRHHKRKDGVVFPVEISVTYYTWYGKQVCLAAIRDITERKRTEEALAASEAKYRSLVETSGSGFAAVDLEGKVTFANKMLCQMLGYQKDELLGRSLFDFLHRDDIPDMTEKFSDVVATGQISIPKYEFRVLKKNGDIIWIGACPSLLTQSGRIYEFLAVMEDITQRKQAEEELKKTLAELERSNAELERFTYVASHDLQEPLRMVSSYIQLLERRYKDKLDADANDFINYAVGGAERMQELLNDLLTYSRVGTQAKPFKYTDMEAVLEAALANLQVSIKESKARVTHDPLPAVMADEGQMVQVLQNLIGNAIKFHGEKSPRIHVSAEQRGSEWVFSVKDNGIGIEPQHFERIFLIFQRLHREEYPGTGTGLAIAQKIIERHGGQIWIESQPGKGSTFYFSIQATGERPKAKGKRHNRRETEGGDS
jgi:PAS domain S-box-containing protein